MRRQGRYARRIQLHVASGTARPDGESYTLGEADTLRDKMTLR
jgi:hypothetical protein